MKLSPAGLQLIKESEGFKSHLYECPAGHCSIGYGTLVHYGPRDGRDVEKPYLGGISEADAEGLLLFEVSKIIPIVEKLVKVPLTQGQFDALIDFAYNLGCHTLQQSHLLQKLNAGDYLGAKTELSKWDHANHKEVAGLHKRRQREAEMFA